CWFRLTVDARKGRESNIWLADVIGYGFARTVAADYLPDRVRLQIKVNEINQCRTHAGFVVSHWLSHQNAIDEFAAEVQTLFRVNRVIDGGCAGSWLCHDSFERDFAGTEPDFSGIRR